MTQMNTSAAAPPVDISESAAMRLCRRGDPAGLATLVTLHQARAIRLAALITRDLPLAEDVVADAFLTAFRHSQSFDLERPFGPWFHRVVANVALKALAARCREVSLGEADAGTRDARGSTPASPGDSSQTEDIAMILVAQEDRAAVRAAVASLPTDHRAALVLKYFAELDEAEIAQALAIPRGTVKSRVFHGLARLRVKLAELRPKPASGGARPAHGDTAPTR